MARKGKKFWLELNIIHLFYHVFAHSFGLFFALSSDLTVNIESRMTPLQYLLDKVFIDQLFAEKKREDFKCEKLTE